jgi:hypothetical protein
MENCLARSLLLTEYKSKIKSNMDKIRVYVLTTCDTEKGIGDVEVNGFATFKDAQKEMLARLREHLKIEENDMVTWNELNGSSFTIGEDYAFTIGGNRCYWDIHGVDIPKPLVPVLVERCFQTRGVKEQHRHILETLALEVDKHYRQKLEDKLDEIIRENLIGESLYQHARAEITPKQSDEVDNALDLYLNYELSDDKDGTWFDKMLAICDAELDPINTARERINEMLPAGKKLYDEDVTVEVTLPKSMLDELLTSGKVTVKKN